MACHTQTKTYYNSPNGTQPAKWWVHQVELWILPHACIFRMSFEPLPREREKSQFQYVRLNLYNMKYYLCQLAERHDCLLQRLIVLGENEKIGRLVQGSDGNFEGFLNHQPYAVCVTKGVFSRSIVMRPRNHYATNSPLLFQLKIFHRQELQCLHFCK